MLRLVVCLVLLACCPPALAQEGRAGEAMPAPDYETALTSLLQETVTEDGRVRYDLLRGVHNPAFRRVLKAVETFDPARLRTFEQKLAFWINAYNVQMLQNIVETPQVRHIIDDGFGDAFFERPFRTARLDVSLNEIENVILRGQPGRAALQPLQVARLDPRLHVGLNCAAVSCPRLRRRAFTAATLEVELEAAMRDFTASPVHFRVEGDRVVLSALLDWYGPDFDRPDRPAGDLLLAYMPASRPGYARLRQVLAGRTAAALKALPYVRFEYLWDVNRAP